MPRDLILGTAGHIDHGKTALVKALTGTDCDRLPDEKRRGITIDIGFARLELGDFRVGIVDVPGHERFVRNMLAGATGIDLAMLVVAADDSVMPQTREHLEILRLLGLRHGVVALTKCDAVDADTRELVADEVRDLVRGTFLEGAPVVFTSAHAGTGLDELRAALTDACQKVDRQSDDEWFRLAIDRSFVVQGAGTVVTGSVTSGRLAVGDEVDWLPLGRRVRVRALHNHDQAVEQVHRGQRAAINLAGVDHADVFRGQELATPGYLVPSRVLTARVRALPSGKRPLKHRLPVRLHLGTAEVMADLSLLDGDALDPGRDGLAQLFLEEPVVAAWGQPFVLRDSSAEHTLGGGRVLQPDPDKVRRRHLDSLEHVEHLESNLPEGRVSAAAWLAGFAGVAPDELVRTAGVGPAAARELCAKLLQDGALAEGPARRLLHADRMRELEGHLLETLGEMHAEAPLITAHDRQKVQARLAFVGDDALVAAATDRLLAARKLVGDGRRIARADFTPKLSANLRKLKDKVVEAYRVAGFQPPEPAGFAPQAGGNAKSLGDLFEVCVAEGHLFRVAADIYLHADAEAEMRRRLAERFAGGGGLTVAEIRDLLGTTRKFAVPICEYLDRAGVTRRDGDLRFPAPGPTAPAKT
jgi:selenocysteine-specific elongation factor